MQKLYLIIFLAFGAIKVMAQQETVFTFPEFIQVVKTQHPLAKQANLLQEFAVAQSLLARGGFDPKIQSDFANKTFDQKNYYSLFESSIEVPTKYGVKLKAGYENSSGIFLNESDFLPATGLWNVGISVPILRGLFVDERRTDVQKAEVFRRATAQERIQMYNELLLEATQAYIDWQTAKRLSSIADEGVRLAAIRFDGIKNAFRQGDKPAIDTLEAFIILQNRRQYQLEVNQYLIKSRLEINNFLWAEGDIPLQVSPQIIPENILTNGAKIWTDSLRVLQDQWIFNHPELISYDLKIKDLLIDERLAKENLKPQLDVAYNPLVGTGGDGPVLGLDLDGYKWGVQASMPLFRRKERAKIQNVQLKIKNTSFTLTQKQQSIKVKTDTYWNLILQTEERVNILTQIVEDSRQLLLGENRKFEFGESSIFLINSRELKYLESQQKLLETTQKLVDLRWQYLYFSGLLSQLLT